MMRFYRLLLLLVLGLIPTQARALIVGSNGTDGTDGAFNPTATTTTIDLSQAVKVAWDVPSPVPGAGVYDSTRWAVVFKHSSVNIATERRSRSSITHRMRR